MIDAFN